MALASFPNFAVVDVFGHFVNLAYFNPLFHLIQNCQATQQVTVIRKGTLLTWCVISPTILDVCLHWKYSVTDTDDHTACMASTNRLAVSSLHNLFMLLVLKTNKHTYKQTNQKPKTLGFYKDQSRMHTPQAFLLLSDWFVKKNENDVHVLELETILIITFSNNFFNKIQL